ncbi:MAG TPA: DUF1698 domain-containing protein [Acidimicrobiia bacterium]|jgi:tRNA (mo5U34)-methyltransferase|nr:DUF1698 domain-containing protein [Acidimicrobiia bacterium]
MNNRWTEEAIVQRVDELDADLGWYQNIDLRNGLSTKSRRVWGEDSDHPKKRFDEMASAIPEDLKGTSVLDIGCNAGFFSFESMDRGATDVTGIDLKQGYIDQANFCADVRGQNVDFHTRDIYDLPALGRTFDLVFCIGILYHCKYLKQAVESVASVASGTVLVETAIHPGNNDLPLVRFIRSSQYSGPDSKGAARLPGHWHPNMTALKDLFYESGFSRVEEVFTDGGRGGIACHR